MLHGSVRNGAQDRSHSGTSESADSLGDVTRRHELAGPYINIPAVIRPCLRQPNQSIDNVGDGQVDRRVCPFVSLKINFPTGRAVYLGAPVTRNFLLAMSEIFEITSLLEKANEASCENCEREMTAMELPEQTLGKSVLVVAHPDDEVLWLSIRVLKARERNLGNRR